MTREARVPCPIVVRPGYLRFVGARLGPDKALDVDLRVDHPGAMEPPSDDRLDQILGSRRPIERSAASTFWRARFSYVWSASVMDEGWEGDTGIGPASRAATDYAPAVEVFDSPWLASNFALWRHAAEPDVVARHFAIFTIDRAVHVVADAAPTFEPRAPCRDDDT